MPKHKSHLSVRMPPSLRTRLETTALASHRTLSEQVLYLLNHALRDLEQPSLFDDLKVPPGNTVQPGSTE